MNGQSDPTAPPVRNHDHVLCEHGVHVNSCGPCSAESSAYRDLRQAARELANVQGMHELAKANYMAKLAALNAIIAPVK